MPRLTGWRKGCGDSSNRWTQVLLWQNYIDVHVPRLYCCIWNTWAFQVSGDCSLLILRAKYESLNQHFFCFLYNCINYIVTFCQDFFQPCFTPNSGKSSEKLIQSRRQKEALRKKVDSFSTYKPPVQFEFGILSVFVHKVTWQNGTKEIILSLWS